MSARTLYQWRTIRPQCFTCGGQRVNGVIDQNRKYELPFGPAGVYN
jgi:hypothetical protein